MIITIGRQFGSGGSEIGRKLSEELQIPYYDKNIIDHVAEKLGFSPKYVQKVEEQPTSSFLYSMAMYSYSAAGPDGILPAELRISAAQTEFIQEKAQYGSCIFVGRCADYVLRKRHDLLNVFIYAEMEHRVKDVMERYSLSEREALKIIQQTDKKRALYYNTNTQNRWGSRESYHLMLDSGRLGIDGSVSLLEHCYRMTENIDRL